METIETKPIEKKTVETRSSETPAPEKSYDLKDEKKQSVWMGILRIVLGVVLFSKGIDFISDTNALLKMINFNGGEFLTISLAHYIAFAHLIGGVMIAFGLITRLACALQIPILLGAVLYVNITQGFSPLQSELPLSIAVLALLVVFVFYGSGPLSVDRFMRFHRNTMSSFFL